MDTVRIKQAVAEDRHKLTIHFLAWPHKSHFNYCLCAQIWQFDCQWTTHCWRKILSKFDIVSCSLHRCTVFCLCNAILV